MKFLTLTGINSKLIVPCHRDMGNGMIGCSAIIPFPISQDEAQNLSISEFIALSFLQFVLYSLSEIGALEDVQYWRFNDQFYT